MEVRVAQTASTWTLDRNCDRPSDTLRRSTEEEEEKMSTGLLVFDEAMEQVEILGLRRAALQNSAS